MNKIIKGNLRQLDREKIIEQIVDFLKLKTEIVEVYLFGSFSTLEYTDDSDIDLLIVAKTNLSFPSRPLLYAELLDVYAPMDILVYTPEEFSRNLAAQNHGFWNQFKASQKLIYKST